MTLFWDRQNKPIEDTIEWAKKFEDAEYRIVAVDFDGEHRMVSTIWQGLDLAHSPWVSDDTAMIFETAYMMSGEIVEMFTWHSEEGALEGHDLVCKEFLGRKARPSDGHLQRVIEAEGKKRSG
jgi:hypothetical protein